MINVECIYLGEINNKQIKKYILKNTDGFEVHILNLGGIINKIITRNKNEEFVNVVLNYDSYEKYIDDPSYAGAIIGPTSGRIENGKYSINGVEYLLDINSGENANHGGKNALSAQIFDVEVVSYENYKGIELKYDWPHLKGNHVGNMKYSIRYLINESSELKLELSSTSDRDSYINLTNHSYFNLAGDLSENGDKQYLMINSDYYCPVKNNMIPTGEKLNVTNTCFDFRKEIKIEEAIKKYNPQFEITRAIDHGFILNENEKFATLYSPKSGIKLKLETTQNVLVIYTGNYLDEIQAFEGIEINSRFLGIALEAQNYQNGINIENFDSKLTTPNSSYYQEIKYIFTIE